MLNCFNPRFFEQQVLDVCRQVVEGIFEFLQPPAKFGSWVSGSHLAFRANASIRRHPATLKQDHPGSQILKEGATRDERSDCKANHWSFIIWLAGLVNVTAMLPPTRYNHSHA